MTRTTARKIEITWPDGTTGTFHRQGENEWVQVIGGLTVTGYDPPQVMRVLATATGTEEIGE